MSEQKPLFLRINEIKFDTISDVNNRTNCFATIIYHPDRKYIEDVTVTSSVFNTEKSERCWLYMGDNYQCDLQISDLSVLSEIADSIRDKEWEYEDTKTPLTDETIKHDVLEIMYNARELFADFIVERLSSGEYDDIAENGGVNLWEFKTRVERDYNIHIPQAYLCDLDNYDNRFGKSYDSRVTRKIKLYRKYKTEYFEIKDVVFDTAPCKVAIIFQPQIGYVQRIWVTSNLSKIGQSKKEWIDIESNGLCDLITDNLDILAEIADCIKDKEWLYDKISPYPKKPLTDESKKQEILNVLYNASAMFADFVYENLKDTTGLMDIWDFKREIKRTYDVDLALCYLFNLFENDSRFVVKNKKFDHADIGINNNSELPDITDENNTEEQPSLSEEVTEIEDGQSETLSENDISNDLSEQESEDYDDEDDEDDDDDNDEDDDGTSIVEENDDNEDYDEDDEDDDDDDEDDEAEYDDDDEDDEYDEDDEDDDEEDDDEEDDDEEDDDDGTSIVEEYDDNEYEDCDEDDYNDEEDEENVDDEGDEEEKPIFGYKGFMDWAQNDETLKQKYKEILRDFLTLEKDGINRILNYFDIFPDHYTNMPFVYGCYQDDKGNWYYYGNYDERTSPTPDGIMYPEEECFKHLKNSLLLKIDYYEGEKKKEAERIAKLNNKNNEKKEKPIFGYKEFMDWVTNDKDLKARLDAYFADRRIKPSGTDDMLSYFGIYPDCYSCNQYVDGCYQDDEGNWYYYLNDERTSSTPNGTKSTEDDCFRFLKSSLSVRIQYHEDEKKKEAERIAKLKNKNNEKKEKPIFGHKEFMDWVTNDKDLKARFNAYFADWKNKPTDIDDILSFFRISPDSYSCGQYVDGCYQDDKGNWYHFSNDERTSTTPNGTRYSEEKCFKYLKTTLLVNLQHSEEDKRREAERIANLTPEQKAEREREAELQEKIHLANYMFFADNYKVTKVSQVKIEVNKIYNAFDDSDEGDENFRTAKEVYIEKYGEKKGIRMLKILKFMTYFSKGMENSGYVTGEFALILQKVNEIFTEMFTQK